MQRKLKEVHWFSTLLFLLNFLSTLLHLDLSDFFFLEKNFFFLKMWFLSHAILSSGGQQQSLFSTMFCHPPVLHDVQHRDTMFWRVPTQVNGVSLDIYSCFGQWNLTGHLVTVFSYQNTIVCFHFCFCLWNLTKDSILANGTSLVKHACFDCGDSLDTRVWALILIHQACMFWLWSPSRQAHNCLG